MFYFSQCKLCILELLSADGNTWFLIFFFIVYFSFKKKERKQRQQIYYTQTIDNFTFCFAVFAAVMFLPKASDVHSAAIPSTCITPSALSILQNPCDDHVDKMKPATENRTLQLIGKHAGDLRPHIKGVLDIVVSIFLLCIDYLLVGGGEGWGELTDIVGEIFIIVFVHNNSNLFDTLSFTNF